MRLIRIFLFFSLSLFFIIKKGNCQYNENKIFQVRIAPLNAFTPNAEVLQWGMQKRFNQRLALAADYGFKFRTFSLGSKNGGRLNYHYYTAKGEVKYFFALRQNKRSGFTNPYFSIQGFYFPQKYDNKNGWLYLNNKSYHYDRSTITRNVAVSSLLIGDEHVTKRMVIDYYIGAGVRKITIHHHNTIGAVEGRRSFPAEIGGGIRIDEKEGNFYRPHLALGFKLGYILNKKQQPK